MEIQYDAIYIFVQNGGVFTISSFKKREERRGAIENIPRRGRKSTVTPRDYRKPVIILRRTMTLLPEK